MNSKLGICIPTYKRPDQLLLCIDSVIKAAAPYTVPIFIADDSADSTNREILRDLYEKYPYIHVAENKQNLGIDQNILNSVNICTCEYAWMLGEDDRMHADAVKEILDVIDKFGGNTLPFVFVNYSSVDAKVEHYLKEKVLLLDKNITESAELFLTQHSWAAGFIGGCVVHKKCWSKIDQKKYVGTYFAHVGTIMEMLKGSNVYLIARSLVLNRCGEPRLFTWSDSTFSVVGGWKKMMLLLNEDYPPTMCQQATKQFEQAHGLYSIRFLCYTRADCAYRLTHYHDFLKPLNRGIVYDSFAQIIACTPPQIFQAIRFLFSQYRRVISPPVKHL